MLLKKRKREGAEINGSSMADIAFLLLIFFLVTTTINVDTGIGMVLPPPLTDEEPPPVRERNLMKILVNAQGLVTMDDEPTPIAEVQPKLVEFIKNPNNDEELSVSPQAAIVSLKTVREAPYRIYIDMLDEVIGAYAILRNEAALSEFGREYDALNQQQKEVVNDIYPKKISIAEPDS